MTQSLMVIATPPTHTSAGASASCRRAVEAAIGALTHSAGVDDHRTPSNCGRRTIDDPERQRELERKIDFFAAVLAMASHDLRQPLQVIAGSHELLALKLAAGPERRHLERAQQASAELTDKLNQLADMLRVQDQSTSVQSEPVQLRPLLQRLAHQLDEPARYKRIGLRFLRTEAVVVSNAVMLDAILRNLTRNALEHTEPGGRVLVGCRRRGAEIHIEVRDNGDGIRQEELPRVFEAFVRLDTASPDGLGLGLFIVRRAADYLGHRVEVRSAPGRGCCFTVAAQAADQRAAS